MKKIICFLNRKFKQKKIFGFSLFFLILLIFSSQLCFASDIFDISEFVATVLYKLVQAAGFILGMSMWFLNLVTSAEFYDQVLFGEGIKDVINLGWKVVRDFLNLFFILILILISIGTILRIPSYGDKKLVFNVVLAALLINFSKPIALFFIDLSQLAMSFFIGSINVDGFKASLTTQILRNIQLQEVIGENSNILKGDNNYTGVIIVCISAIIFFLIMAVMLFVLATSLLVRVVAYWILIILSPLAMFGLTLPHSGLGAIQKDWMRKMLHWSFFGPIQLFFLWLTVLIMNKVSAAGLLEASRLSLEIPRVKTDFKEISLGVFSVILPFVASIYLLFYGYDSAKNFAEGGAQRVMNWGSKQISKYGKKYGKYAAIGAGGALALGAGGWVAAGAGVAGLGSYYGGKYGGRALKERTGAWWEGKREKLGEKIPLLATKKQKEEKKSDLRALRVARAKGPDEEMKYWRVKANKTKKELEDSGVDDKNLKDMIKEGKTDERKAAALLLAERGKVNDATGFEELLKALGGDKILEASLRKKLKDENMYAYLNYDINRVTDLMNKASSDSELYRVLGKDDFIVDLAKAEGVDVDNETAMTNFLVNQKAKLNVVSATGTIENEFKQGVFDRHLDSLTSKQLANQNILLYEKEGSVLKDYFSRKMRFNGDPDDPEYTLTENDLQKKIIEHGNARKISLVKNLLKEAKRKRDNSLNSPDDKETMRSMSE